MKKFEVGQEYLLTQDAITITLARVVEADGKRVTFEFSCGGKTRRLTARIRTCNKPSSETAVLADYDAFFAYNALGKQ